jgi:hypothetical protein
MPKRKYTDAQRAAMGRTSAKRKPQRLVYDDEDTRRRGANLEPRESNSGGSGLILVAVAAIMAFAYLLK